jgi:predicted transcriptional regulator
MASEAAEEELRAFTVRLSPETYIALKRYAALAQQTMSSVLGEAIVFYLARQAEEERLDAILEDTRAKFQETVKRLAES